MQYDASTTDASQAAEIAEGHEQQAPPPLIARQPRRGVAPSQKEDEMHEAERRVAGEDEDGDEEDGDYQAYSVDEDEDESSGMEEAKTLSPNALLC